MIEHPESLENMNPETSFKWNPEKVTLLLPVPKPDIDPAVVLYAAENGFAEKSEFHLSIISFANGKKIMDKHAGNVELLEKIRLLADEFAWKSEPLPGYFVIEKYYDEAELQKSGYKDVPNHTRKTIVQRERRSPILLISIKNFQI